MSLISRGVRGAGRFAFTLLEIGPLDAVELMINYAGSYEEAWATIEKTSTRSGIAIGIAAGMMGLG